MCYIHKYSIIYVHNLYRFSNQYLSVKFEDSTWEEQK